MQAWPGQPEWGLVPGSDFPGAIPPVVRPHVSNKGLSVVYFRPVSLFLAPFSGLNFLLESLLTSGCPPWALLEKFQLHLRIKGMKTRGKKPRRKATNTHLATADGTALRLSAEMSPDGCLQMFSCQRLQCLPWSCFWEMRAAKRKGTSSPQNLSSLPLTQVLQVSIDHGEEQDRCGLQSPLHSPLTEALSKWVNLSGPQFLYLLHGLQ